jgi:glycine cleavage system H protein
MTAGVLCFRLCDRDLDCSDCPLDRALRNQPRPAAAPAVTEDPVSPDRPGRIFLHPGHLWVRLKPGGEIEVGLDELAARLVAPVHEVRGPAAGDEIAGAIAAVTLVTGRGTIALPAPFDGVVTRTNPALAERPALVTDSPWDEGWLFRGVSPDPMAAVAGLMRGDDVAEWLACEAARARDLLDVALAGTETEPPERREEAMSVLPPRVAGLIISKILDCTVRFNR